MPTIFSRIIAGELPGTFVWKDDRAVAFLSINPMMPGHALVVPRAEVDHWIDLDPALAAHLFEVAQQIGKAQDLEWKPRRIGVLIVGEEVPHTHLHVVPINHPNELTFAHADPNPDPASRRRRGCPHARPPTGARPFRGQRLGEPYCSSTAREAAVDSQQRDRVAVVRPGTDPTGVACDDHHHVDHEEDRGGHPSDRERGEQRGEQGNQRDPPRVREELVLLHTPGFDRHHCDDLAPAG